jgi:hypothetical protein
MLRYRDKTVGGPCYTYSMNKNKTQTVFCNSNLPSNAVNVANVVPGMRITFGYDSPGVHTVIAVSGGFDRIWITTDSTKRECRRAGTVRLADADGYNYHAGHGCEKDI